jgi:hypothetical protein
MLALSRLSQPSFHLGVGESGVDFVIELVDDPPI